MNIEDVALSNICVHDSRYSDYSDLHDEGDLPVTPRKDCYCDNCFNGRDRLAVIILELLNKGEQKS